MFDHEGDCLTEQLVVGLQNFWRQLSWAENMCAEESTKVGSIHLVFSLVLRHVGQKGEEVPQQSKVYFWYKLEEKLNTCNLFFLCNNYFFLRHFIFLDIRYLTVGSVVGICQEWFW